MRSRPNVGLMLVHRLRRWANIKPTLGQRLVFAGSANSVLDPRLHCTVTNLKGCSTMA